MNKILYIFGILISTSLAGQTSSQSGQWTNNSNWIGGSYPGTHTVNPGDDDLDFSNETISVDHRITVGANDDRIDMNFANSNNNGSLTIEDNDTLIVYGDWSFANKSMDLNIGNNAVVIVMGDATFANKMNVATTGTLIVSGNFDKAGSQGSYTGGGAVYAGSYSGNADSFIPGDTGTGGDQQQTIDDLSDDGFTEIEEFVSSGGTTPLPVELLYFNVQSSSEVILTWATATEINNDYFSIERSEDGVNFYEIGRVDGNGDSNSEITYEFTDKFVLAPVEYYRLKQVDFDGQFEYFHVKRVETNLENEQVQIWAYPTLVQNGKVYLSSTQSFQVQEISIYNLSGGESQNLKQHTIQENPLSYLVDLGGLTKGFYLLRLTTSDGNEFSSRVIVE